jgi:type I restriction enzyme M protein
MKSEVVPHVPDAVWQYEFDESKPESNTNKERLGAEFPFTRYFYEYHEPENADGLLSAFLELESSLTDMIRKL